MCPPFNNGINQIAEELSDYLPQNGKSSVRIRGEFDFTIEKEKNLEPVKVVLNENKQQADISAGDQ